MIYRRGFVGRASKGRVEQLEHMKLRFSDEKVKILQKKLDDWTKKYYKTCKCCGHVEKIFNT